MQGNVQPQAFLGKVAGCSSYVSVGRPGQLFAGLRHRADLHHPILKTKNGNRETSAIVLDLILVGSMRMPNRSK